MDAAIVEAADVAAGDTEINVADFHVGHFLGLDDGIPHVLLGLRRIHDFALADAARARLAEADDVQRAVGSLFADHGADFRRANFQTDNDVRIVKHFSSTLVPVLSFLAPTAGAVLDSIQRTGTLLATARSSRGDGFVVAPPQIVNFAPARQLLLQILQTKSDFAALARRHDDDARRRHVNAAQIHQAGHRRMAKCGSIATPPAPAAARRDAPAVIEKHSTP
jgi:hypothetical protein